jgi:hypothetical protein
MCPARKRVLLRGVCLLRCTDHVVSTSWCSGFFDPLGLSKDIDQDTFDQYRAAELKHGRVAQLAVIGYVVPELYRFPGEIAPG